MKVLRLPHLLVFAAILITGCDSVTGPASELGAASGASERPRMDSFSAPTMEVRGVPVCHIVAENLYKRILVPMDAVEAHLLHGDEYPDGAVLDGNCAPIVEAAVCPCYSSADLGAPLGSATPQPYVFFDVYRYYSEDLRRTEVRSTLNTGDGLFEEVAAVYITPTGDPAEPLAPLCFRQDVTEGPVTGEPVYTYETRSLTIPEAEACRQQVYAFAEPTEPCQGGACGLPYTEAHLDPDFPPYHDDGFRTPTPVLDALRARVEAMRQRLTIPA